MDKKPTLKYLHVWGCSTETKIFNSQIKKFDYKTIGYYFVDYLERLKSFRYYYYGEGFKIVETKHAVFLEN